MLTLYHWSLSLREDVYAGGYVTEHPRLTEGHLIHTSPIQNAEVSDGRLVFTTLSDNLYTLLPEAICPQLRPDAPVLFTNVWEDFLAALAALSIDTGFAQQCLQARAQAEAERRAEAEHLLAPGELLLEAVGTHVLNALYRTADGELREVSPMVHSGMFQDSILVTDWEGRTVDFRYFPKGGRIEPYHISDGLHTIKVRSLGSKAILFGAEGREVPCPPETVTAIPTAEHDCEGLFSPDAVNGKNLFSGKRMR